MLNGAVAQWREQHPYKVLVEGSNPFRPIQPKNGTADCCPIQIQETICRLASAALNTYN